MNRLLRLVLNWSCIKICFMLDGRDSVMMFYLRLIHYVQLTLKKIQSFVKTEIYGIASVMLIKANAMPLALSYPFVSLSRLLKRRIAEKQDTIRKEHASSSSASWLRCNTTTTYKSNYSSISVCIRNQAVLLWSQIYSRLQRGWKEREGHPKDSAHFKHYRKHGEFFQKYVSSSAGGIPLCNCISSTFLEYCAS